MRDPELEYLMDVEKDFYEHNCLMTHRMYWILDRY